ncbi:MAG TPA: tRNA epoxyqueuosine(34) reductase QueG, partial [Parvularculaceae bacterium]|nr:tRNA epoxyqueuosine(34) reductase QueG [Parvularculaceae bacterium]
RTGSKACLRPLTMPTSTSDARAIAADIKAKAGALGFDECGVTTADAPNERLARLNYYLHEGRHGDMGWMEMRKEERASPRALWSEARSVIMLAVNYGPEKDPLLALEDKSSAAISVYAQNKDYHDLIKKRLKALARWLVETHGGDVKVFVDTAPVMEKPLAAAAGLGWQGKHTNLVSRDFGSWVFVGAVFSTLEIAQDDPETDHCGACTRCLSICPTDAFPAPYQLDARRCISYLTIEHKSHIPRELRAAIGNRIYGCDDCLAVCPWNKFAQRAKETAFHARGDLVSPPLEALSMLDDAEFRARFSGSPIKRIGVERFLRNVLIAIGNSGAPSLAGAAIARIDDPSPLIRVAAVWALSRLSPAEFRNIAKTRASVEEDADVVAEWRTAP